MKMHGTLAIETRTSTKTGKQYQALVFTSTTGRQLLFFEEKAKAQYLQHLVEMYQENEALAIKKESDEDE